MKVIKNERVIPTDIDETLILHDVAKYPDSPRTRIYDAAQDRWILMAINEPMLKLVREELHRGTFILVWSRGGFAWAKSVINALGLEHDNMIVMTKPAHYFDDKPVSEWMADRVYLSPETIYKK